MAKRKLQQAQAAAEPADQELEQPAESDAEDAEIDGGGDNSDSDVVDAEPDDDSDADIKDFRKRIKGRNGRAVPAAAAADAEEGVNGEAGRGFKSDGAYRNKQRVLIFSSRGVTSRSRHLIEDLRKLIPHHKKDVKLDVGRGESLAQAVNAISEMKSCNNTVFFECRKKKDIYMWVGKTPHGPSGKFLVMNIHTMDELKLTGNCMMGSRPLLSFDDKFQQSPHWQLTAALLTDVFGTPRGHPKSKPFIDRIMSFYIADNKVWVRNYQIIDAGDGGAKEKKLVHQGKEVTSLVEIGPRFVLEPIRLFSGSFGGPTLYQNPAYVSPNEVRANKKRAEGAKYHDKATARIQAREKIENLVRVQDPTDDIF